MNHSLISSTFVAWLERLALAWHERRRLQRDMQVLWRMNSRELNDLGISHAAAAAFHLPFGA